jgi:hypothetical protein
MQILNQSGTWRGSAVGAIKAPLNDFQVAKTWAWTLLFSLLTLLTVPGCRKDPAAEASDSDANGYLCLKCGAKLYTSRSNFIGPLCPKCQADELTEVVGYSCPKDNHLTILPRANGRQAAPICEQCQSPVSAMRLPREKDLKAWGATKAL